MDHDQILELIRAARDAEPDPNRMATTVELGRQQIAGIQASIAATAGTKDVGPVSQVNGLHVVPVAKDDHFAVLFEDLAPAESAQPIAPPQEPEQSGG